MRRSKMFLLILLLNLYSTLTISQVPVLVSLKLQKNLIALTLLAPLVFLSILIYSEESRNVADSYTVKTKKIECNCNHLYIANYTCKLKPINWKKTIGHMEGFLIQEIKNASLRLELFKYTNQFRPFLVNVTVNICKWFDKKNYHNPYGRIMLNMVTKFSNFNHSCPYSGYFEANDLYLDPERVKFVIPPGTFMFAVTLFEGFPYINVGTLKAVTVVSHEYNFSNPQS